jgi:hypothetical protein
MQTYFSKCFVKLKIEEYTKPKKTSHLNILNWKSAYDVMLSMCQSY